MSHEYWLPIPEFMGIYEASSLGRIRRIGRARGAKTGRILSSWRHPKTDRLHVRLSHKNVAHDRPVHVWMALAFLGPRHRGYCIHHRDGDYRNNRANNLSYLVRGKHTSLHKAGKPGQCGEAQGNAKLTDRKVREMRKLYEHGWNYRCLAKRYAVSSQAIYQVIRGKSWTHVLDK